MKEEKERGREGRGREVKEEERRGRTTDIGLEMLTGRRGLFPLHNQEYNS